MRIWLQHYFHPVNLWSRLGGRYKLFFTLYERYLWQAFLRKWLNGKELAESQPICEVENYGRKETISQYRGEDCIK